MISEIRAALRAAAKKTEPYFRDAALVAIRKPENYSWAGSLITSPDHYWNQLSEDLREQARQLVDEFLVPCAKLADATKKSPLTGSEDLHDIKVATKGIRAALFLRAYQYSRAEVIHDEGTILGLSPAEQRESVGLSPEEAQIELDNHLSTVAAVLKLIEASPPQNDGGDMQSEGTKYVSGTAFIMMWMDSKNPELNDVLDTVKSVFKGFDIQATRADDIEHEGQITDRILNEIKRSEFLFADLTGMRPNVYYETGYAHALGKRVILYRKRGTELHFDLAGYNCPEYESLRDLKDKLTRRLIQITSKDPRKGESL